MTLATAAEPVLSTLHVTAYAVPDPDPPYDDADGVEGDGAGRDDATARYGPAGRRLPPYPVRAAPSPAALRLLPPPDAEQGPESFDPVRTPREQLDDPVPRAAMLARAVLEALAGIRPVSQLARWVVPEVLAVLQSSAVTRAARPAPTALRRVLVCEPTPGIAEVTAVVDRGPRVEAMALRLEGLDGRWLVTALQRA